MSGSPRPAELSGRCRTGGRRPVPSWFHRPQRPHRDGATDGGRGDPEPRPMEARRYGGPLHPRRDRSRGPEVADLASLFSAAGSQILLLVQAQFFPGPLNHFNRQCSHHPASHYPEIKAVALTSLTRSTQSLAQPHYFDVLKWDSLPRRLIKRHWSRPLSSKFDPFARCRFSSILVISPDVLSERCLRRADGDGPGGPAIPAVPWDA